MSDIQAPSSTKEIKQNQEEPKDKFQFQFQGQFESAVLPQTAAYSLQNPQTPLTSRAPKYHDAELKYAPIFTEVFSLVARHASTAQNQISTLLQAKSQLQIVTDKYQQALELLRKCETLTIQTNNCALCAADRALINHEFSMLKQELQNLLGSVPLSPLEQKPVPTQMTFQLNPATIQEIELTTTSNLFDNLSELTLLTQAEVGNVEAKIQLAISSLQTQIKDFQTHLSKVSLLIIEQEKNFNPAQRLYEILNQYS